MTTCTGIKKMGRPIKPENERNVVFGVSLPPALVDDVEEIIKAKGWTRSAFVRRVFEDFLTKFRASDSSPDARG